MLHMPFVRSYFFTSSFSNFTYSKRSISAVYWFNVAGGIGVGLNNADQYAIAHLSQAELEKTAIR